ncbi:MAG: 50S ribosomal protein L1, partial [Actinomycetota bacterium]
MSGKRLKAARAMVDRERLYQPMEAVRLLKETPDAKFDETVEVHFRLGINVRHAEEQLRGTVALPNGLGKDVKIAVFAQGDKAKEAQDAGADHVGADDLAKKIEEGFD